MADVLAKESKQTKASNTSTASIFTPSDLNEINTDAVHLVFGYIRRYEVSSDFAIPFGITMICLSYYLLHANEYFAHADSSHYKIIHTKDCNTIEVLGDFLRSSAYGNVLIPSSRGGIYVWTFQMLKRETSMFFGITTEYDKINHLFYRDDSTGTGHGFALSTTGSLPKNTTNKETTKTTGNFTGPATRDGEIIKMNLNLNNRTLRYEYVRKNWTSEENFGFDNIPCGMDIHYKMAIRFLNKGSKIALLDFCVE